MVSLAGAKKDVKSPGSESVSARYGGNDTWVAATAYLYLVSILILLFRQNNSEFVQFHARQGLVLSLLALIFWFLPLIFGLTPNFLGILLNAAVLILIVIGAVRAYSGKRWEIPYISDIANSIDL